MPTHALGSSNYANFFKINQQWGYGQSIQSCVISGLTGGDTFTNQDTICDARAAADRAPESEYKTAIGTWLTGFNGDTDSAAVTRPHTTNKPADVSTSAYGSWYTYQVGVRDPDNFPNHFAGMAMVRVVGRDCESYNVNYYSDVLGNFDVFVSVRDPTQTTGGIANFWTDPDAILIGSNTESTHTAACKSTEGQVGASAPAAWSKDFVISQTLPVSETYWITVVQKPGIHFPAAYNVDCSLADCTVPSVTPFDVKCGLACGPALPKDTRIIGGAPYDVDQPMTYDEPNDPRWMVIAEVTAFEKSRTCEDWSTWECDEWVDVCTGEQDPSTEKEEVPLGCDSTGAGVGRKTIRCSTQKVCKKWVQNCATRECTTALDRNLLPDDPPNNAHPTGTLNSASCSTKPLPAKIKSKGGDLPPSTVCPKYPNGGTGTLPVQPSTTSAPSIAPADATGTFFCPGYSRSSQCSYNGQTFPQNCLSGTYTPDLSACWKSNCPATCS
jgi:hypothetical protein